ncbi:MAG: hypothetical protein AAF491_04405 [Verrucomicrobiota bacterium]
MNRTISDWFQTTGIDRDLFSRFREELPNPEPEDASLSVQPSRGDPLKKIVEFSLPAPIAKLRSEPAERSHQPQRRALPLMNELALQIIREQWPRRNHPNQAMRQQARSLIKTHIYLLRDWRLEQAA